MKTRISKGYRLTETASDLLAYLALRLGMSQTAVLELLIRERARKEQAQERKEHHG